MNVLIVDDSQIFRVVLKEILQTEFPAIKIHEAADGKSCLRFFENNHGLPDFVFMDIKLPDANGLDLTKQIRSLHSNIPIVVVTSNDTPEYRDAAEAAGADAFLGKGSTLAPEILKVVKALSPGFKNPSN